VLRVGDDMDQADIVQSELERAKAMEKGALGGAIGGLSKKGNKGGKGKGGGKGKAKGEGTTPASGPVSSNMKGSSKNPAAVAVAGGGKKETMRKK
jgi:hypothetical protein